MSFLATWTLLSLHLANALAAEQTAPFAPERALETFQHDPAVRVELVASEPLVFDPVALCFDACGRLYVVENRGYPTDADGRGDVILLGDADGDGRMDTRTIFAEGFDFPNGLMAWKGGVLLTCAPDVLYLADTDGDGRADVRETVLTGFAPGGSTQLRTSHPTLNVDGWIYFTNGLSGGNVRLPGAPESAAVKMGAMDLRWNPWDNRIETTAGQAQFGQAFDTMGNKYVCSNRKHIEQVMLQPGDIARNPTLAQTSCVAQIPDHEEAAKLFPVSDNVTTAYSHTGTFTAACGLAIYKGTALGASFEGNGFVCDPTGNLVHRDVLDYTAGAAVAARRAYADREFLASPDNWFRPVYLANGPDGALYLCDMYRKTIEHPVYLPPEIAAKTDFQSGRDMGRIYRFVAADAPPHAAPEPLAGLGVDALIEKLKGRNGWERDTAFRLLLEQGPGAYESAARKLCRESDASAVIYGLRLLMIAGADCGAEITRALENEDVRVRETAVRLFAYPAISPRALHRLLCDANASLCFRAALAAADAPATDDLARDLAEVLLAGVEDPWLTTAVLSSGPARSEAFLHEFAARLRDDARRNEEAFLTLAEAVGRSAGRDVAPADFAGKICRATTDSLAPWQLAALMGCLDTWKGEGNAAPAEVLEALPALLHDSQQPVSTRVLALRILGHGDFARLRAIAPAFLRPEAEPQLELATIRALAKTGAPEVGALLTAPATWTSFSSDARTAAKAVVFSRGEWIGALLDAMERGELSAYTLDPAAREQLMKSGDKALADRATKLFAQLGTGDREKVFDEHKTLLTLPGHRDAGHAVFTNTCAQCHVFQGEGHKVGPELSDIRAQTPEYILLHLIVPNKAVTAGYESYTVATKSLETFTGILAEQNEHAITLRQALGAEQVIERANIESLSTENRSLMPDELEKSLTEQQIRDLIAFLKGEEN